MKKYTYITLIIILIVGIFSYVLELNYEADDSSWNYTYMDYPKLHKYSTGKSQTIALIDSGISEFQKHDTDIMISVSDENVEDTNGHGTMMLSLIKGYKNKVLGISPDVKIISIKVLSNDEKIPPGAIAKALKKAIDYNVDIINLSIGSYKPNSEIAQLVNEAISNGINVVASSGDYSDVKMMFPANMDGVISVGAIDKHENPVEMTSGSDLTIINAPGGDVETLSIDKKAFYSSGTSQSTALISGYISLLRDYAKENNKTLSNDEIQNYLKLIKNKEITYTDVFKKMNYIQSNVSLDVGYSSFLFLYLRRY